MELFCGIVLHWKIFAIVLENLTEKFFAIETFLQNFMTSIIAIAPLNFL